MGPLKNTKHEAFVLGIMGGKPGRQAYLDAGYQCEDAAADTAASRLLKTAKVSARMEELKTIVAEKVPLTKQWLVEQMMDAHDQARDDKAHPSRIRSLELLGREKGAFTEQREYTFRSFDQMTTEEIEEFLAGQRAKGVAPEAGKSGSAGTGKAKAGSRNAQPARRLAG